MRPAVVLGALFGLAACPICPTPELRITRGNPEGVVLAADLVQLEASYGDWRAGRDHCDAHWFVQGIEGGNPEIGTVDACGTYRAPAAFPPGLDRIDVEASEYPLDGCLDCCPYAAIVLRPVR